MKKLHSVRNLVTVLGALSLLLTPVLTSCNEQPAQQTEENFDAKFAVFKNEISNMEDLGTYNKRSKVYTMYENFKNLNPSYKQKEELSNYMLQFIQQDYVYCYSKMYEGQSPISISVDKEFKNSTTEHLENITVISNSTNPGVYTENVYKDNVRTRSAGKGSLNDLFDVTTLLSPKEFFSISFNYDKDLFKIITDKNTVSLKFNDTIISSLSCRNNKSSSTDTEYNIIYKVLTDEEYANEYAFYQETLNRQEQQELGK